MHIARVDSFEDWRREARRFLAEERAPSEVAFREDGLQADLFGGISQPEHTSSKPSGTSHRVPGAFLELAKLVGCHRNAERWNRLYRVLWRITHGEPHLLEITTDEDVHKLHLTKKAVTRDRHKMKAFVRFRKIITETDEHFIAWHRPDHRIVRLTAPFFARRFPSMNWSILTPDESVSWDQTQLRYGPGVPASEAPAPDDLESLWKTYYGAIFNPARIKLKAMTNEMPVRHWPTLPETEIINELLDDAPRRVKEMLDRQEGFATSAQDFFPGEFTYQALRDAARDCQGCDLHHEATQAVFGTGPLAAELMIVGEQPGDREDIAGVPFVGPAGEVLNEALTEAGIDREAIYLTNSVKHFKFRKLKKVRQHQRPDAREMSACKPWLEAEIALIQPRVLICLGVTAAQQVIGRDFKLTQKRGEIIPTDWCELTLATFHPAAILRMPHAEKQQLMRGQLIADLRMGFSLTRS